MKLEGKNILITGASSGIGKAFALRCARDKCNLFLAARSIDKLKEVKKEIEGMGSTATIIKTDVTKSKDIKNLFLKATKGGRVLDVVLDNAGLGHIANIYEQTVEEIESMVNVNVRGMFVVAKYASEVFVRQKYGHLIITSSLAGLITVPGWATYVGTKWAITGFADSIRMELKPFNVRVSSLHPGLVKTEFFDKERANMTEEELDKGNAITVDEVAEKLYSAVFTDIHKIMVPDMVKSYAFFNRYLPSVAQKIIESQLDKQEQKIKPEDEPDFSYVKSLD